MKDWYHTEGEFGFIGIEKEDFIKYMHKWANDDKVTHFMLEGIYPSNVQKLEERYNELINGSNVVFAIINKKNKEYIGTVGLYNIAWQARMAEFRIFLGNNKYHGKGLGTIASKFMVKYAFYSLNLNKVWLGVNIENKGAVRCYEKAGFIKEGVLRQEVFRNNRYYDAIRMSILREEYEKL